MIVPFLCLIIARLFIINSTTKMHGHPNAIKSKSHEAVKYVRVCMYSTLPQQRFRIHFVTYRKDWQRGQHRELGCALLSEPLPTIARYVCIAKDECGCSSIIYFCSGLHFYCCKGMYLRYACCATFLFRIHAQECCTS